MKTLQINAARFFIKNMSRAKIYSTMSNLVSLVISIALVASVEGLLLV
ncbi:hypothetical protein P9046_29425 [Bacillus cereus]|nr:hypothetical protein [Bacillus thuringiensis]MEC2879393.1 hypothetical protein [Bacillus cereus]MEC3092134.1 hypothetical protein [Bacillus cereus]MEC3305116.1 hypothetical protein [Bacillus cereus]MEC3448421.1 hypothetical protein [Bacillus thuringiensis]MEC3478768.1 hypothetical protein [Bacillus cereus]